MKREALQFKIERTKRRVMNMTEMDYRAKAERAVKAARRREKYRQLDGDYEDRFYRFS